jgi:rare lipoprotein A
MTVKLFSSVNLAKAISFIAAVSLLSACAGTRYEIAGGLNTGKGAYHSGSLRPYAIRGKTYSPYIPSAGETQIGMASWYGEPFHARSTSNGEPFDMNALSAAHKTWPLPSLIEVTNLETGRRLKVRLNDRGPFIEGRIVDLSKASAKALGIYAQGTAKVRIKFLGPVDKYNAVDDIKEFPQTYRVQIGVYREKDNAHKAMEQLEGARLEATGSLFKVYLGPLEHVQQAEVMRNKAIDVGFKDAIITKEP